jgi:RNA polymerase sigma-70 factor (family 1)
MDYDEINIIDGIRSGKETAFRQLFLLYYAKLVVFARKYLNDLDTARDLVQDFLIYLYESRDSLTIQSSLKSYLYSSVKNRCLNHLKHIQVQEKYGEMIRHSENGLDHDLEQNMEATELEARIFEIVSSLPEHCKRIYTMSRVDGKLNQEIADELNLSKRTVETQISKALKVLRDNLLPLGN